MNKEYYSNEFNLDGSLHYYTHIAGPYKNVAVENGYFDMMGLYYEEKEKIRYYSQDGTIYRYYSEIDKQEQDESKKKKYYLKDNESNIYPAEKCFINSDGYVVIDSDLSIKQVLSDTYKNAAGEKFTRVFETSRDENSNLIDFDDYV